MNKHNGPKHASGRVDRGPKIVTTFDAVFWAWFIVMMAWASIRMWLWFWEQVL